MPNRRRAGIVVSSYTIPADLLAAAATRARNEGRTITGIIREALSKYVEGKP